MSSALILSTTPATPVTAPAVPATAPVCGDCGETLYAGRCLAVGQCETADTAATRGAARTSAKYRPAAWTFAGGVD